MPLLRLQAHPAAAKMVGILIEAPLLSAALCGAAAPCEPPRDASGRIARSSAARREFQRDHPCPATGARAGPCPGYRIDHIKPLKRCGADTPANMQWLTIEAWRDKTRWE